MTENPRSADQPSPPGAPRWVKIAGIIALVVVLAVVVMLLIGGHGPGRHLGGDHAATTVEGHAPPPSGH